MLTDDELRARLATEVMRWGITPDGFYAAPDGSGIYSIKLWNPLTDIMAAWRFMPLLERAFPGLVIEPFGCTLYEDWRKIGEGRVLAQADTLPRAICYAVAELYALAPGGESG